MKANRVKDLLKPLYFRMDKDLKDISNICEKGCYYCCFQPIEILTIEKVTLAEYITKELDGAKQEQIKLNVLSWLDFFDNNTSNTEPLSGQEAFTEFRFRSENIPITCPLLFDSECIVYKVRPLTCRAHLVNDSKDLCKRDKLRDGSRESMKFRTAILKKLQAQTEIEIIPLAYALVEILHIGRKIKTIKRTLLHVD